MIDQATAIAYAKELSQHSLESIGNSEELESKYLSVVDWVEESSDNSYEVKEAMVKKEWSNFTY
tara:strand:+ start:977 stop:1168 length:192 start_codon:yes stop_codon:yes gene_type:complete